jgi:hypothetical protein
MDKFLEFAIVGAWIWISVGAVSRVFNERRRWQREHESRGLDGCLRPRL